MSRVTCMHRMGLRGARGFSIVELMVAMTLSLILMAGALSILYSSKLTYSENERIARLQEAGRTVMELVLRDARASGYEGCTRPTGDDQFVNGLTNNNSVLWDFAAPMYGYDAQSGGWSPAVDAAITNPAPGSDIIVLRTTPQGMPTFRTTSLITSTAPSIPVSREPNATVEPGTAMVISDCWGSSVFVATAFTGAGETGTISHSTLAIPGKPSNASDDLRREFRLGALVMPVQTTIYYVSDSVEGPALFRKVGTAAPEPLIEGVENIQVLYGIGPANQATSYVKAGAVTNWDQVVSLTISVLVRAELEGGVEQDRRTYTLLNGQGETLGPFNDRRQRSVFTSTVVLRNRAT